MFTKIHFPKKFLAICLIGMAILSTGIITGLYDRNTIQTVRAAPNAWVFEGRVFEGEVGNEDHPLAGITVSIYGSNDAYPDPGTLIISTETNEEGWYSLEAPETYEFYKIIEVDPSGYESVGATTVDGIVREANWIEYVYPIEEKTLTGNKFWDSPDEEPPTPTLTPSPTQSPTTPPPTATPPDTYTPTPTQIVWLHFDDLTDKTFIENQYTQYGVHFLSDYLPGKPYRAGPKIHAYGNAHTSPNVLLNEYSDVEFSNSANVPLVFWFDQPVSGVGMWLGTDGAGRTTCNGSYQATIKAYDCAGNLIVTATVTVSQAFNTPLEIDDAQGRIQRVVIDYGNTTCPEAIDELAFSMSGGTCSDTTAPQVSIISPQDGAILPSVNQLFKGKIVEPGILSWSKLNGSKLPVYMSSASGEYTFNLPVVLKQGTNSMVVTAANISGLQGSDTAIYQVGTPTKASLTDLHITQRGVVQKKTCDIDLPFVAGKSALVRIGLDIKTPGGTPTYASSVEMQIYRQGSSGDVYVDSVWGTAYPDSYNLFISSNQMKEIHFWVDGNELQTPGKYRFKFQPYVSTTAIGSPIEMNCGGYYHTFSKTKSLRVLLVPVELGINSPALQSISYADNVFAQVLALARSFPVADYYSYGTPGVTYAETAPFQMCDGTAASQTLNPKVCQGTGWEWEHIYQGSGNLLRADDMTVIDNSKGFCNKDDHKVGGRIQSSQLFSYTFDPNIGLFRPGAHPGWAGDKHMTPTDEDHDGDVDMQDMQKFIASFFDLTTNSWLTDLSKYDTGETFRFFADTNSNQCNNTNVDTQAPIRKKFHSQILWNAQKEALNSLNAQIPGTDKDYTNAILIFPNSFIASDCKFGCIGPGQGEKPGKLVWTRILGPNSTFAHEVGHNVGNISDLYYDSIADDLLTKEKATAVYINKQKIPPNQVYAAMGVDRAGNRVVHYLPDYKALYNKLVVSSSQTANALKQDEPCFLISGRILADGNPANLFIHTASGLETTPSDESSPYRLVFGSNENTLLEYPFSVGINAPPPEGFDAWEEAEQPFAVIAPYPEGTNWVELRREDAVLERFEPSAHTPSVQILAPNGGEVYPNDTEITIRWSGEDLDGENLLYSVFYSPDAGETWHLIAPAVAGNELTWSHSNAPGSAGNGLIRVQVSDGFLHHEDSTDETFTVENKPPLATILSPAAEQPILACSRIQLDAAVLDLEGDLAQIEWWLDGQLTGESSSLELTALSPGEHEILLRAVDSSEAFGESSRLLSILADSDCDGMSDEFEEQYGFDSNSMEDAYLDNDDDGLTNVTEAWYGLDPTNPDSDGDGYQDGNELSSGSDPSNPDSAPITQIYLPLLVK